MWPQQLPPSKKNQKLWNKALKDTVCIKFKQLHEPVEDWLTEDINWGARFNPLNLTAYRREKTFWFQLDNIEINRKH
eukprot:11909068-Ditylum_brightwellii.AAC.1